MRAALVAHGLPPHTRTGVATHVALLARALAQAGVHVEVFVPRTLPELPSLAQRREARAVEGATGSWAVTWCNAAPHEYATPEGEQRLAEAFGAFLDRERPQVVHFEHLVGVGPAGIAQAKRRGLATVYVAHDYWALHDARFLLRPDLASFGAGDAEAEARGRLALQALRSLRGSARAALGLGAAGLEGGGGLVLREQLSGATYARVHGLLHGDIAPGGLDEERSAVRERQAAKRAAITAVDARFATSREVARRLSGLVGRAFAYRATGLAREPFAAQVRPTRSGDAFRIGFVGAIEKQRGLHVLLEAAAGLEGLVEVHVHGDSSDRAYVARCRRRAEAIGAVWHGGYDGAALPRLLAGLDAVCLPSLWCENAPFVLREAYAAGLPVIASDTESLRESVPTDEGSAVGLLVPRGDVGALRSALRRISEDADLCAQFARNVRSLEGPLTKRVAQEAGEWLATYAQLVGAAEKRRIPLQVPAHVAGFARRVEALEGLSTRELFERVSAGLGRLGAAVGVQLPAPELLAQAVGRGSRTRDERAADARAMDWLRRSVAELGEARARLESETRWREDQLAELEGRVGWFERRVREREEELLVMRSERDDHGSAREVLEEERERLRTETARREAQQRALTAQVEEARQALRSLSEERDWLRDTLDRSSEELRWLREHVAGDIEDALTDREAIEMHFERLCEEQETLRKHELWLREQVLTTFAALRAGGVAGAEETSIDAILASSRDAFTRLLSELSWRRNEMDEARAAAAGLFTRLTGGDLAARASSWAAPPPRESLAAALAAPRAASGVTVEPGVVRPAPRGAVPSPTVPPADEEPRATERSVAREAGAQEEGR